MKLVHALFLLIALLSIPAMAADTPKGARNFIWGVGPADVQKFEKAIFYREEGDSLEFLEDKNGRRTVIRYDFDEGKLWRINVSYFELFEASYQDMFDLVMAEQADLTSVYGKPSDEQLIWKKTKYKKHPKFWSRAYGYGDLKIVTEWQTKDSLVRLTAYRDKKNGAFYQVGYTVEDSAAAAEQEAAKLRDAWKTP